MLKTDLDKQNRCTLLRDLLCGLFDIWLFQASGDNDFFGFS